MGRMRPMMFDFLENVKVSQIWSYDLHFQSRDILNELRDQGN